MLDINFIRENQNKVRKAIEQKKAKVDFEKLLTLDNQRRELIKTIEDLRQQRNVAASNKDIEKGKGIKGKLEGLEVQLKEVETKFDEQMILVPNVIMEDVPEGVDESGNQVIRKWGEPKSFTFTPKDHIELGKILDVIDIDTASKVAGTRFAYLKNEVVLLQFAIIQYTFQILAKEPILKDIAEKIEPGYNPKPFVPVLPPDMVRPDVYTKMARLDPFQAEERYYLASDDLYLIGSAEHTLGPIHMDQIIEEKNLPLRYVGYSTSFRREAGSYGRDTKGIIRVHQFDKIEIESFTLPEHSVKEQNFIVAIQEYLLQSLNLPYQVVMICTGDMGGPDARQLDIETWMPGQGKYRETHTSDLITDYQARRLKTRVKRKDGKIELVHMNDATAFALGRIIVAILENFQQADGSVIIPEVLRPFTGFSEIKPKD
ncbi:MAG: Serine-tRNA ligase [Candidatus Daviesbacteria bacterium GW2011_GWA1_41_61]|uniref:Serine--tRNA ligase n=1 Tax=Candidatus Daviesbacteria bacterium GW2011_GWA2_40_9 TaxID=1618424 RepID=A0A0G0WDH3_9BACT|nr:MAG: Serine-tRNA ligase [Candidatus Daviesbacteria bacterium GW2011_GWC1_40_9]KKR82305.1 MAG: Serine-tRNA ligase [Candidatus Daviesbacteria bacterium GW2011_GWA2_40_9]KKR93056.1 MAG: Serine-tRNA ligase [Candidatus Daviesbacteria bacterium GW2011_GWB1_41_15]KKS15600.1 MAG: Serine-tRNA ligase [Candidatus Daviesbacteria bacterium GW2011_GWA1_41_61]